MGGKAPLWARWRVRGVSVRAWARVRLRGRDGPIPARLLTVSPGWITVEVDTPRGPQCQIWPPDFVRWGEAVLLPECGGVAVEIDGTTHRCARDRGDAVVWAWVRRAIVVGGRVEGLHARD